MTDCNIYIFFNLSYIRITAINNNENHYYLIFTKIYNATHYALDALHKFHLR